jgi:ubiquinone/menaquinone biosynthesis C-methylase UbiE
MHSLVHSRSHAAVSRGHALGLPRLYHFLAEFFFFGRRRATFESLVAAVGIEPAQRVLDLGCGTGYFVRLIALAVGPTGQAVGLDPSTSMIDYARCKAVGLNNCEFQIGSAEALDFPSAQFDIVVSTLVMHHPPEDLRVRALQEMRRVLRPGGHILVAEAQNPCHGPGWRLLARMHGFDRIARAVPDLESLAARAGFAEVHHGEAPPWLRYVLAVKPTGEWYAWAL